MSQPERIFSVRNEWCEQNGYCGEIILVPERWKHVIERHPEMEPHQDRVASALDCPNLQIYLDEDGKTLKFYARNLMTDAPRYRDCYVAAFVRYQMRPAYVWTAYLPIRVPPNPGKLLHATR